MTRATAGSGCFAQSLGQIHSTAPDAVLRELFELLEEFGPVWYTEEHHDRAVAALAQAASPSCLRQPE